VRIAQGAGAAVPLSWAQWAAALSILCVAALLPARIRKRSRAG
jgi:hypothetical protein